MKLLKIGQIRNSLFAEAIESIQYKKIYLIKLLTFSQTLHNLTYILNERFIF